MIYNFTDDSLLDKNIKINFKKKLLSEQKNYSEYIGLFSDKYKFSLDWWVSLPASRNNFISNLYYDFCICEFIKDEINQKKNINEIIVNSRILKKILDIILSENKLNINVKIISKKNKNYKKNISVLSLNFLLEFVYFGYYNLRKLYFAFKTKKNDKYVHDNHLTLIDTYILPEYINDDRYYNNITQEIPKNNNDIFFVPTVVTTSSEDKKKLSKIYNQIRKSKRKFLLKEDYLNFFDILYSLFHYFRLFCLKKYKIYYKNNDYSSLIYNELFSLKGFNMAIESLLNYRFIKKLKKKNIKIKYFINWWENQPLDKSLNFALNKYYKKVKVMGYLGYVPRDLELNIYPFENEIIAGVIPKTIGVIGKGYVNIIKKFTKNINIKVYPALRFEHLWNSKINKNLNNKYIFVPLPILLDESLEILDFIFKCNIKLDNKITFLIKNHPATAKKHFTTSFKFTNNIFFTDKPTSDLIHNAQIIISGVSSICMESISLGIPTLIIEKNKCMIFDPIPKELISDVFVKINNYEELNKNIIFYMNSNKFNLKSNSFEYKKIKDFYFEKPTKFNKKNMLNLTND